MVLVKGRGFTRTNDESSEQHLKAMRQRKEKQKRFLPCSTNSEHILGSKVSGNERLPLRGDTERTDFDEEMSGGLFLNTLGHLLFKMYPKLEALARRLHDNAKYTSPDVQNEVFQILATMVKEMYLCSLSKLRLRLIFRNMIRHTIFRNMIDH